MEGAGECLIIVRDMNKSTCHKHSSYNREVLSDFNRSKLSQASQTNHNTGVQQKTNRSAQAQYLYDCPSNIYRTPPAKRTEYYTEFPPQKKFCPSSREHSPVSSLTDPFAVSLRQYSRERQNDSSGHLLRKLLIYTQTRSSPKNFNVRSLRTAIRKSHSAHKEKLLNKKAQKKHREEKDTLEDIYRSNSCKNIGRECCRKPSPIDNGAANVHQKEESKVRHAKVGAGTKRPKPDLSTTYDYLQNSSCSLYLPRGILDRTTEVRYLDDVTRCVKDTIKMLCESEKVEPCPSIASRYMQHLLEYHHRDAQAQANFQRETADQKPSMKNWSRSFDFDGASLCTASRSCRQERKKCHFEPISSCGPVCYFPDTFDSDEELFPNGSIGGIVQEWMRGIPINANFTPTDRILRDRIVVELTNNISPIITEPNFEATARKLIFNYLSDLPMWLPEGGAQVKFKNQIVDDLIYRLLNISYVITELKSELFRWVKNVDYKPRYDDGEIITDYKIVNIMAERLEPLIVNRPENESVHKSNLQREIYDEILNIPLDVSDEFKRKVINNLADDLTSRLLWLSAKSDVAKKRSESLLIRNIINDWMENIPVNPYFSQIDIELREQLADDLANNLKKFRTDPDFKTIGRDAIVIFLNNLPMWWPGDDDKDVFINELANKLIYKLETPNFTVELENLVSRWAGNIETDNVDDLRLKVLDKILPIISSRQQLSVEDYKSKLKRSICEELRNTPIDFNGENKSMAIDRLSENLTEKLIGLDIMESNAGQKTTKLKSENNQPKTEYDKIFDIVNNWVKTLPVNHDFSIKEKQITDQMTGDLAKKLTHIKKDANIEPKVKEASLQFLTSIPIWTPDDNGKDKFMIDMSNKLCDQILRFYSTEKEVKLVISKWAEKITHMPRDEGGYFFDKMDIIAKVALKITPVVLSRTDNDVDYNNKLKNAVSEELKKIPLEVRPEDKNRVTSELAEDLANLLMNLQCKRTESKPRSSVINDTVLKWLNDIPVKSDFKLEDDELRKELGEQLIDKLTKLTDDPSKLIEIPMEAKAKKAVIDSLNDMPMWRPAPGKEYEYNDELVNKLFSNLKDTVGSASQSPESKSDESRSHSTNYTTAEISDDTTSRRKRESRLSDSGRRKIIDLKTEERQKSNVDDSDKRKSSFSSDDKRKSVDSRTKIGESDKGNSNNASDDKRKFGDSKNEKRPKSNARDSSRIKSSDSSEERRKLDDSENGSKRKSNASDSGKIKPNDSSKDSRKSGDSKNKKRRKSNTSDRGKIKSSDSSGDRQKSFDSKNEKMRKSNASDSGRIKSSDSSEDRQKSVDSKNENRHKSDASDSGRIKSSDSSGNRRKSGDSKNENERKLNTNDTSRKKSTESTGDRKSREEKRKTGDLRTRKGRQSGSSDIRRRKSTESSQDRRKLRASDAGKNKPGDTKRTKSISRDKNERKSRDSKSEDNRRRSPVSGANIGNLPNRESKSGGSFSNRSSSPQQPQPSKHHRDSAKRKSSNCKSHMVPSEPSVEGAAEKKLFDILKDNSMFAHLSPVDETHAAKNIMDKLTELPSSGSVKIKNFIDEAVSEWIDVLEKKSIERHFTDNLTKCFKIDPDIATALDKKYNQNLVHELACRLAEHKTTGYNKEDEEKIKNEVKIFVQNVLKNENIAAKKQSVEIISQAIMNVMQRVQKDKNNLKLTLETEITQWMNSIPEISNASSKNEHKRALKKLVYDIQMLAIRKTSDSVVMNRMQEKITFFLETVLQKENVVIEPNIKKKYKTKLLNHIFFLIKQNKKNADSVKTLKNELLFCLTDVPLFKDALSFSHGKNMKNIFHIILGLDRNRVNDRENSVINVISEFITGTIEKSHGSISAQTKSILANELLDKLNIKEKNNQFENEERTLTGYFPGLSNKLDTLKLLKEEVIKNHISSQSNFNRGEITEDDQIFYHDMTHEFAEILENHFYMIYGKDKIKDISEYLQSLIHHKGSPVDHSVVYDLTRELMADVSINIGTKRNKLFEHLLTDTSKNLKHSNEDDKLCKYFDSSTDKLNDCNVLPSLKGGNDDNLKYTKVTSEDEETPLKKHKNFSNRAFLKGRRSVIKRTYNTSPSLYKTYDTDHYNVPEKRSTDEEQEQSKNAISPCRSHATQMCNQEHQSTSNDFSNKLIISGRYSESLNGKGNKKANLKSSYPPSTSQSSEDITNNTYSLRKYILKEQTKQTLPNKTRGKSMSSIRITPSSHESSDGSPIDEAKILSIIKRHLYQSHMNDPGIFNVVPCINRPGTSKATIKVRGSDIRLYHTPIKETNKKNLLPRNRSPFERKDDDSNRKKMRGKIEHFEEEPCSISTIVNKVSKNVPSSKSGSVRKGITEILVRRVGLSYKEAGKFADILLEKTNNIYKNDNGTSSKTIDTIINSLKFEIQDILRRFHIGHILEETEESILNLLTNQVIAGEVDDKVRTSLINILAEVDGNSAAKVADSLLDHVNKMYFTAPPKSSKRKSVMAQDKCNPRQQFLTALSAEDKSSLSFGEKALTSEDKQKYLEVRKDIVDFVTERVPSLTSSVTEIIDTATDDLLRIYINSKENKEMSTEDLDSVVRRDIKNFLFIVPIETNESKNELIDKITNKLHYVDSIMRSSSGERTTRTLSKNLSLVWTHVQEEAFLRETKKLLNDILEGNDIDVSQAKHLTLELDDKLREIMSNKRLSDVEKLEHMKKELFQYFRNLSSLFSTNITPDELATQVIDQIPSIIFTLAAGEPNDKDFIKDIVDFIRAKTGDMTPNSLQQLQAQVEEVMAVTKSILDDSDMTPNEKSDIIKLGFSRLLSEVPRQSSETSEQLASELYEKIFYPPGLKSTIASPSLTSSNEEVMITKNNETRYLNQLMKIIRNWTDQVSMIRDEINDTDLKDDMARDLAKDITDRQKYIQLNTGAKTSDEDELEYLKYQVFRWFNRTLDVNDLSPFVNDIEDLMEQIRRVPICSLAKPSNKLLEDEIAKWVEQVPCNRVTPKGNTRQIKELADKIQRHRGKSRADSKLDNDINQFIPHIFREDETTLKALGMQLKTFLKNQGLLRSTNARTYKTGAEDLYELVEDWCRDLPIYLGVSPEEQERVKTIKQNINSKLINKIGELNMNPQILNDDFLYEDLLLDEVDKLLTKVPRNPEMEKYLPALKRDLISRVKGARQKIRDEQAGHSYIQQLRDTIAISAPMPEPLYPDEIISFEILRENLVDAFINLHYVTDNNEDDIKFKRKISDEIGRFCNDYLRRHPCTPINPELLSKQLHRALQAIPIPKDESMRSEIEELKIKEILFEWVKEIPLKEETGSELLQRNKTIAVLAKRLHKIEKEKESNINFDSEGSIREEITKWLRKNPLKVGHESELPKTVDKIVEILKKPEHVLDFSISFTDDCSCPSKKPVVTPCTLSSEDKAHLKRIRDKYNSPCITGKSSLTIDSASQTIESQTWCPNLKTPDRVSMCASKQLPFPCPAMMSSASPYEMHHYPNVNVKNYIWDSMDSKISSTQTPHVPCQSRTPYCMQKQKSTQQHLPDCNSVSSQVCPEHEPVCPRSSAFKCSQSTQARPNAGVPCSTPKTNRFIDSQDSDEEDSSSEDYNCSPCRPTINSGVCRICRPSGALYSSFLPRKTKKKGKKKRSSDEFESPRFPNRLEACGNVRPKTPCSCRERKSKKGDKFFCYRDSKTAEDECLGHSEAECPHPSYMYFRN